MPNPLEGLLGGMQATPRNKLMGLLADGLKAADRYANRPDPTMPMGKANPPLSLLSDFASLKSLAEVANNVSYGYPLTNAGVANVPFLKPETGDALMMAPISPRNALAAAALAGGVDSGAMRAALGAHHLSVLDRASKGVPDDVIDAAFGNLSGYVYHTPYRPFENAQATAIGAKATPIADRIFSTESPLSASALAKIEAVPISSSAMRGFSDELANEGAMALMHRDGRRFSVVMPSAKERGRTQLTNYDASGAIGDSQHDSAGDAIQRLIESGFSKVLEPSRAEALMRRVMLR